MGKKQGKRKHQSENGVQPEEKTGKPKPAQEYIPLDKKARPEDQPKAKKFQHNKYKGHKKHKPNKKSENDAEKVSNEKEEVESSEPVQPDGDENTEQVISKRQQEKRERFIKQESEKNKSYLELWKNDKKNWKFQKLRQISLQQNVFDVQILLPDLWPIALEYLGASQGFARKHLQTAAEQAIKEIDEEVELNDTKELLKQDKYIRARDLVQMFAE